MKIEKKRIVDRLSIGQTDIWTTLAVNPSLVGIEFGAVWQGGGVKWSLLLQLVTLLRKLKIFFWLKYQE